MSNTRNLEICSEYRNRNLYPYASQFDIEISQSGTKDKINAVDPISEAAPLLVFNQSFVNNGYWINPISGEYVYHVNNYIDCITGKVKIYDSPDISNTSSNLTLVLTVDGITVEPVPDTIYNIFRPTDFYNGAVLEIILSNNNKIYRRIFKYEKINDTNAIVTLETPFGDSVVNDNVFNICNPSDNSFTPDGYTKIYIPYGSNADNFYINYYITSYPPECNIDNTYVDSNSLKIISYDGLTHLATLNGKFNDTYWPNIDPNNNSVFALRKELPCNQGILLNTTSQEFPNGIYGETYTSFYICSNVNYTGDFLRIPEFYDNLDVNPPYYNGIRKIIKYQTPLNFKGNDTSDIKTIIVYTNTFSTFSSTPGYYNGLFIRAISITGEEVRIISNYRIEYSQNLGKYILYFDLNMDLTFTPIDCSFIICGGIIDCPFKKYILDINGKPSYENQLINDQCYEILCFNRDNAVPFNYTGSMVSQQEEVCYEIELLDLVLPNRILVTGRGSRITFYPYVYVELSNVSSPGAGQRGILYSNNPNSNRMLFRCPIDDIPNPIISPFIKIDGDGAVQTIKFKINDNLRFSVRLPNGELLITDIPEYYSPLPPNPINQISAYFSLKRL
jgi:hypothetical protein